MNRIEVHYAAQQVSHPQSASPSPGKPVLVVNHWREQDLPIQLVQPIPVTREQFALAHAENYVDGILGCTIRNGFGGRQQDVADSLPWTTGSFLSAARGALKNGQVACSPTSGFHHAYWNSGGGYCTFNGLMVAACLLKSEGHLVRLGILDCDQHFGDGTTDIIDHLGIDWIRHITAGRDYPRQAAPFLSTLPDIVRDFKGCDLLMYQAGADPHIDDPLGGFLTTGQLAERDRLVFATAHELGLPVVWNLAGGYQEPLQKILEIHLNTMKACITEYLHPAR